MLLQIKNISKYYKMTEDNIIKALCGVSLNVKKGEFVAIMGPSGSGKSTFLQVASMLSSASDGKVLIKDKDVTKYDEVARAKLRNKEIGFIFQAYNLLPRTSAIDNVSLPLIYAGVDLKTRRKKAIAMLKKVGLGDRLENTPAQLSGGQQQRVAIARALINDPSIIFADEPTGNLDSKSGEEIKKFLIELNKEGKTIIMVTHEADDASIAKRLVIFKDGKIIDDSKIKGQKDVTTKFNKVYRATKKDDCPQHTQKELKKLAQKE
jgi:putative ABC transport system ATP-binding protein